MAQIALEAGVSWLATSVSVVASGTWQFAKWSHKWMMEEEEEEAEVLEEQSPLAQTVDREKEFHNYVRQQIICMWLFMLLYLFAYWVISKLKRKTEREALYAGEEDYLVYRVSVWISSTATATSIGSLTLLPFSVIGVELLQLYEGNYYLQWLSYSLIGALWHYVFMLSNLSLFVLLPFSYFFIESQGFSSSKVGNGITERIYEAMAISFLFAFVLLCLAEVALTILDYPVSFLSITSLNLPLIYSCVSFTGALLLLISIPYGFGKMFSAAQTLLMEEAVEEEEVEEELEAVEDVTLERTIVEELELSAAGDGEFRKDSDSGIESGSTEEMHRLVDTDDEEEEDPVVRIKHDYASSPEVPPQTKQPLRTQYVENWRRPRASLSVSEWKDVGASGDFHEAPPPRRSKSFENVWTVQKSKLYKRAAERRGRLVALFVKLRFPVVIAGLLVLTACSLAMVSINTLKLVFGFRSLPAYAQYIELHTRHSFGLFGAMIETLIIIYVMFTSFVGLYSLPLLRNLRPVRKDTPMPTLIINSSMVLVVASALPVIVNTLGMTTFDLLGAHSSLQWLGSFRVVVAYNVAFVFLSVAFLFNQLTAAMRRQIWKWICQLRCSRRSTFDADDTIVILASDKKDN